MNAWPKLKTMRCKLSITLILLSLAFSARAQVPEYSRSTVRSFAYTPGIQVDITNKYGKIQVSNWDKDSVRLIIELRIRAKDREKMERMKQMVEFEFTSGQTYIIAKTSIGENSTEVIKDLVDIAGSYLSSANSVTINYQVFVPAGTNLKINNKFGDVLFDNHAGNVWVNLSYGDIRAGRLNGKSEIHLSSGDAEIDFSKEGTCYVSYGNLHIRETGRMAAETRSSNITIDKAASLRINSRRDKLFINEVGTLTGQGYFSAINCGSIQKEADLDLRYGSFTASRVSNGFSMLSIGSELTHLRLGFEKPANFQFSLSHPAEVDFRYPESAAGLSKRLTDVETKMYSTAGRFGTGGSSRVLLRASKKCAVVISVL